MNSASESHTVLVLLLYADAVYLKLFLVWSVRCWTLINWCYFQRLLLRLKQILSLCCL